MAVLAVDSQRLATAQVVIPEFEMNFVKAVMDGMLEQLSIVCLYPGFNLHYVPLNIIILTISHRRRCFVIINAF